MSYAAFVIFGWTALLCLAWTGLVLGTDRMVRRIRHTEPAERTLTERPVAAPRLAVPVGR